MSVGILWRIYREYGIRKKKIRLTKQWTPRDPLKKELTWALRASDLESMKRDNFDIVYIDEVMFTKHTIQ